MILYFFILFSSVFLAWQGQTYRIRRCSSPHTDQSCFRSTAFLVLAFVVLYVFSAIRCNVAIDYASYVEIFEDIRNSVPVYTECGFNMVVKLISTFTNDDRVLFAAFSAITVIFAYQNIKKSRDWALSTFLFVSLGYYFYSYQSIRQYIAYMIGIHALCCLADKKTLKFIVWTLVGATFHKSCLIILPSYYIASIKWNTLIRTGIIMSGIAVMVFQDFFRNLIFQIYPSYEGSVYDVPHVSYKNLVLCILFGLIIFIGRKKQKCCPEDWFMKNLWLEALYVYMFCWWMPEVSRIGYYFLIPLSIYLPNLIEHFTVGRNRSLMKTVLYITGVIIMLLICLDAYSPTLQLLPYQTIFINL